MIGDCNSPCKKSEGIMNWCTTEVIRDEPVKETEVIRLDKPAQETNQIQRDMLYNGD